MLPDGPGGPGEQSELVDVVETDYFAVSADSDEETISIAFFERNLIMEFSYDELLDFADVIDRSRTFIEDRVRDKGNRRR